MTQGNGTNPNNVTTIPVVTTQQTLKRNLIPLTPAGLPDGDYTLRLEYIDARYKESDKGKGYVISYDFHVVSGPHEGEKFRQWFTTYGRAQDQIRTLLQVCGQTFTVADTAEGPREHIDTEALTGCLVQATVVTDVHNPKFKRLSNIRPAQTNTPDGFVAPPSIG